MYEFKKGDGILISQGKRGIVTEVHYRSRWNDPNKLDYTIREVEGYSITIESGLNWFYYSSNLTGAKPCEPFAAVTYQNCEHTDCSMHSIYGKEVMFIGGVCPKCGRGEPEFMQPGDVYSTTENRLYASWFGIDLHFDREPVIKDFDAAVLAEKKRKFPKRKKLENVNLSESEMEAIGASMREKWCIEQSHKIFSDAKAMREHQLAKLSDLVTPIPDNDMHIVKTSCDAYYRSTGNGHHYAVASLKPLLSLLRKLGFRTVITQDNEAYQSVKLRANCPAWMADALERRITIGEALRAIGPATNPHCLYPGISCELAARHYAGKV